MKRLKWVAPLFETSHITMRLDRLATLNKSSSYMENLAKNVKNAWKQLKKELLVGETVSTVRSAKPD